MITPRILAYLINTEAQKVMYHRIVNMIVYVNMHDTPLGCADNHKTTLIPQCLFLMSSFLPHSHILKSSYLRLP